MHGVDDESATLGIRDVAAGKDHLFFAVTDLEVVRVQAYTYGLVRHLSRDGVGGAAHRDDGVGADLAQLLIVGWVTRVGQGDEKRPLLLPDLVGDPAGGAVDTRVGDVVGPEFHPGVEVLEGVEFAVLEEVSLHVQEDPLVLAFAVGVGDLAQVRLIAVVAHEVGKARVPKRLVVLADGPEDDGGHAVVHALFRDPAKVLEGADVSLEQRGLAFVGVKAHVGLSRVAQGRGEGVDDPLLSAQRDAVGRPVELHLFTRIRLEAPPDLLLLAWLHPLGAGVVRQDGEPALVALLLDLAQDAGVGEIASHLLLDRLAEGVELACPVGPPHHRRLIGRFEVVELDEQVADHLASHAHFLGDLACAEAQLVQPDDLLHLLWAEVVSLLAPRPAIRLLCHLRRWLRSLHQPRFRLLRRFGLRWQV